MDPSLWNLTRRAGRLCWDGHDLAALADRFGTPLHVASAHALRERCAELRAAFAGYPGGILPCFSYKTNPVAGVLQVLHAAGLGAEVVDGWELWLAQRLGVPPERTVVNGANKSAGELCAALDAGVGMLVVDSLDELARVDRLAAERGCRASIGLRICPDVVPRGLPVQAAAGSRRNLYGLDLADGEADEALRRVRGSPHLRLRGAMAHIGTGIHHLESWRTALRRLIAFQARAARAGAEPDLLDVGGGLGTRLSRSFRPLELLLHHALGRCPGSIAPGPVDLLARYGALLSETTVQACRAEGIAPPRLVLEPGRALVSDGQLLLLRVGAVKRRRGVGTFALVDGGAMTVSMMFLVEFHAVFLANREAPPAGRVQIFGRLPTQLDLVARGLRLPALREGDVLCAMNSGAYFTSTATNFGGPRPAVALLDDGGARLVRRRETCEDLARVELCLGDGGTP